jgi:hypothetical protein
LRRLADAAAFGGAVGTVGATLYGVLLWPFAAAHADSASVYFVGHFALAGAVAGGLAAFWGRLIGLTPCRDGTHARTHQSEEPGVTVPGQGRVEFSSRSDLVIRTRGDCLVVRAPERDKGGTAEAGG